MSFFETGIVCVSRHNTPTTRPLGIRLVPRDDFEIPRRLRRHRSRQIRPCPRRRDDIDIRQRPRRLERIVKRLVRRPRAQLPRNHTIRRFLCIYASATAGMFQSGRVDMLHVPRLRLLVLADHGRQAAEIEHWLDACATAGWCAGEVGGAGFGDVDAAAAWGDIERGAGA